MEYKVNFTNFGYSKHYASEEAARAAVKDSGFEASIWKDGTRIASWTVFGGWKNYFDPVKAKLEQAVASIKSALEIAEYTGMSGVTVTYKALEAALREAEYALEAY